MFLTKSLSSKCSVVVRVNYVAQSLQNKKRQAFLTRDISFTWTLQLIQNVLLRSLKCWWERAQWEWVSHQLSMITYFDAISHPHKDTVLTQYDRQRTADILIKQYSYSRGRTVYTLDCHRMKLFRYYRKIISMSYTSMETII